MDFDFELILFLAVVVTGIIGLIDILVWAPKRRQHAVAHIPVVIEYARSFFPILLIVLLLRSFLVEPFRIPSGSEEPTLLVGDFIVANKFAYGIRLPVIHTKIFALGEPKVGDHAVFRNPENHSVDLIKRIVGVPGDHVSYVNKTLYINGKQMSQELIGQSLDEDKEGHIWPVIVSEENLNGLQHKIFLRPDLPDQDRSWVVPPGHYLAMGDNRDNSKDSRYWGYMPEENLVGKAMLIWFSWDSDLHSVRWSRIGQLIH